MMNMLFPEARQALPQRGRQTDQNRSQGVTAILGPTNTGKTHHAITRMLQYPTGMIGLPLRLLAREVYGRVVEKVGTEAVALITGEEKIKPKNPRYWIATVEAMPRDLDVAFVALDEIQLGADLDRGHIFTDRLLNRRGTQETLLIGAATMERMIRMLVPGCEIVSRPRLSTLSFAGERKLSRLPRRSAIVAFSAEEVYAIAELIRRQRGGAAVVLGALSPRTRNAQIDLYQSGDVDYIVATDAIGMGLNLDVDHIAFAGNRKFDGWHYRQLNPAEYGQIAGRAGRHIKDGTFGSTGRCPSFDPELIEMLEEHRFDPVMMLQWRNTSLDFSSLAALQATLEYLPTEQGLTRAPIAVDQLVLDIAARDDTVLRVSKTNADIRRLWDVCQIPDYRKLSPSAHSELVLSVFGHVVRAGHIPDDWFARHIAQVDRTDGDIDTLSARIAEIRTWTFIANRPDWLRDPEHWQGVARRVEDTLSDALHERLASRFVDRRTSVLMRRLRENVKMEAEITSAGDVNVEGQHVGSLQGFRFTPDPGASGEAARALLAAAHKALASEIEARATRVHEAVDESIVLARDGMLRWLGEVVGRIAPGEHILKPMVRVLADETLTGAALEMVQKRLDLWMSQHVAKLLGPLTALEEAPGVEGMARGIAFQVAEELGVLERSKVNNEVKNLDAGARAALRALGVRFGAFHLFVPALLKPAPRALCAQLWALKHGGTEVKGLDEVPHLAASGRTSFIADKEVPKGLYRAAGFRICGERAVRIDILERLADLIRPALAWRSGTNVPPPPGAAEGNGFVITPGMTSLAGCSVENFGAILASLGYASEKRPGPAILETQTPAETPKPAVADISGDVRPTQQAEETPLADAGLKLSEASDAQAIEAEPSETAAPETVAPETVASVAVVPKLNVREPDKDSDNQKIDSHEPLATQTDPVESMQSDSSDPENGSAAKTDDVAGPAIIAEPVMIDVWFLRPAARHNHDRGPSVTRKGFAGKGKHQTQSDGAQPAIAKEPKILWTAKKPPEPAVGESGDVTAPSGRDHDRPRGFAKGPGSNAQERRPNGPRHEGQGHAGPKQAGTQRSTGPYASTEAPAPRQKQPDPNSPFAKLLALKAQLEGKN